MMENEKQQKEEQINYNNLYKDYFEQTSGDVDDYIFSSCHEYKKHSEK